MTPPRKTRKVTKKLSDYEAGFRYGWNLAIGTMLDNVPHQFPLPSKKKLKKKRSPTNTK